MADEMLKAALDYAARGWPVVPLKGKKPILDDWPTKAPTDPKAVRALWKKYPSANVGIVTGERSGLFVLDVDPKNDGDTSLATLLATYGALPPTVQVKTGSGGSHYYFQFPETKFKIKNSASLLGKGLDIKTTRGQVVAPPSIHPDTERAYEWIHSPDAMPVAPVPQWLLDLLTGKKKKQQENEHTTEGSRNTALTREAGRLRHLGLDEAAIYEKLTAFNTARCVPPLPDEEVRKIAASVARYPVDLRLTDVGIGQRFAREHQGSAIYCWQWGQWLVWDGMRWARTEGGQIESLAKHTAFGIYAEAAAETDDGRRRAKAKWAAESEREARLKAMVSLARSEPAMSIQAKDLDCDLLLLNCQNGTLDLRTGALRAAGREDYLTKLVPVPYRPKATCPLWEGMLTRLFGHAPTLREYLQRILGYALTGVTTEQCFFIFYGLGANGKSTILSAILKLLGDYATSTRPETFLSKHHDGIPNDVAALAGARFVTAIEHDEDKRLAESLIKGVTGGDSMNARFLHKEYFSFQPQLKLFIGTNHRPMIRGTDHGMWRRVRLVPFTVVIPDEEKDAQLPVKLLGEQEGILAWLVAGCLEWQRNGLGTPVEVGEATADYRQEQDVIGAFLSDECEVDPKGECTKGELYDKYRLWCGNNGQRHPLTKLSFGRAIRERGYTETRIGKWRDKAWIGLKLRFLI